MNLVPPSRRQKLETPAQTTSVPELISSGIVFAAALCLAGIVFAVYSPALDFQFILDDHRFTADPRIQFSGHVWEYFSHYVWAQFTGGPPSFYRPLFILWMRVNFIFSALSAWGWHFGSITAHVAVAALLGLLVWRLLRDRTAALLAATLFALHPAQAESVAWVTVPDPLMSACVLGATILYLKHAATRRPSDPVGKKSRKPSRGNETVRASVPTLVASVSLYFLALLAKETAIVMPVIIFALALITRQNDPPPNRTGKSDDAAFVSPLRKAIREILPFAVVTVLYLLLRFHAFGGKFGSLTQHLPWSTVILSWPATLWFYVKVLAWPVRSHAFADPTLTARFSFDRVLLPGLGVACAVGILAAGWFWVLSKARRDLPAREASGVESSLVIGTLLLILPILPALHLNALNPGDFLHGRYNVSSLRRTDAAHRDRLAPERKAAYSFTVRSRFTSHLFWGVHCVAGTAMER